MLLALHSASRWAVVVALLLAVAPRCRAQAPRLVTGTIDGRPVMGLELLSTANRRMVLGSDGWIHDFDPARSSARLAGVSGAFEPMDSPALRRRLAAEFGSSFETIATQHFLVVQPQGRGERWAATFERLHRTFTTYFAVRGMPIRQGNFPMIAVVMPDEASMHAELARLGIAASGVLGVYDRSSNRIIMYDHGDAFGTVSSTICHEAAHQSAFNTGVHSRVAETPLWIIEGIGSLFQGPSFIRGNVGATATERCDLSLLESYRETYHGKSDRIARDLRHLVESDAMFTTADSRHSAYALAWALTFYLSERRPAGWIELVQCTARRPPLGTYSAQQRIADYHSTIGVPIDALAAEVERYMLQF